MPAPGNKARAYTESELRAVNSLALLLIGIGLGLGVFFVVRFFWYLVDARNDLVTDGFATTVLAAAEHGRAALAIPGVAFFCLGLAVKIKLRDLVARGGQEGEPDADDPAHEGVDFPES